MTSERVQRRIERLLDQVEEAADQRDWARVREFAEDVLAFAPENPDATEFLVAANRRLPQTDGDPFSSEAAPLEVPSTSSKSVEPAQPTSFAAGRYQVSRFLGEGGKKKVYLAHDTMLDRDVAIAL